MTQNFGEHETERNNADSVEKSDDTKAKTVDLIDEEDRAFCRRYQEAFDKSYIIPSQIAELMK